MQENTRFPHLYGQKAMNIDQNGRKVTQTSTETAKMPKSDTIELYAIGAFDSEGTYLPYTRPILVKKHGYALLTEFGHVLAVQDIEGAWLEESRLSMGFRSEIKVQQARSRPL